MESRHHEAPWGTQTAKKQAIASSTPGRPPPWLMMPRVQLLPRWSKMVQVCPSTTDSLGLPLKGRWKNVKKNEWRHQCHRRIVSLTAAPNWSRMDPASWRNVMKHLDCTRQRLNVYVSKFKIDSLTASNPVLQYAWIRAVQFYTFWDISEAECSDSEAENARFGLSSPWTPKPSSKAPARRLSNHLQGKNLSSYEYGQSMPMPGIIWRKVKTSLQPVVHAACRMHV